jgi:hypothetical protein
MKDAQGRMLPSFLRSFFDREEGSERYEEVVL